MATFSKLTTYVDPRPMNGSAPNTPGYSRMKIDRVVIHHNGGTNYQGALNTWLVGGPAGTSAHYEITPTQIIGAVEEERSAWHAGTSEMNRRSIGLEHVNSTMGPKWEVAEATLKLSAKLCADICKRYGIPIDSAHIIPHKQVVPTDCPGGINMGHYIDLVRQAAGQTGSSKPAPAPSKPSSGKSIAQLAQEVIAGKYGTGVQREAALGSQYAAVQAEVNRQLGQGGAPSKPGKSVNQLAQEVIAGKYGSGEARKKALGSQYNAVQAEVNRILGAGGGAPKPAATIKQGSTVRFVNPIDEHGTHLGVSGTYTVMELRGSRAVVGRGGAVTAATNVSNLRLA